MLFVQTGQRKAGYAAENGEICCGDREKKTAGQIGNREIELFEKLCQNIKTDVDREMLLNIFVKRIYVSEPEKVIIYWRIKK